jgi:hypothetical protein
VDSPPRSRPDTIGASFAKPSAISPLTAHAYMTVLGGISACQDVNRCHSARFSIPFGIRDSGLMELKSVAKDALPVVRWDRQSLDKHLLQKV